MKTPVQQSLNIIKLHIIKLQPATLLKRDSGIGVFLWILRKIFKNTFFYTPLMAASEPAYDIVDKNWTQLLKEIKKTTVG